MNKSENSIQLIEKGDVTHSVVEQINTDYYRLTKSMRKVADYILKEPRRIVYMPITELAQLCGVSEYTIMKFCKVLGYSGFQELKLNLAKDYVKPLENIHEEVEENDELSDIASKLASSHILTLQSTKDTLDLAKLQLAIEAINKADKLEFYGMGTSAVTAKYAYHKFFRLNYNCRHLEDGHMQAMSASLLGPNDVVIAISNSGSNRELIDAVKEANKTGATTICITGHPQSPITKVSSIKFFTESPENLYRGEPMENMIAQVYLIDSLFVSIALKRKEKFISNLEKTRKALADKKM